MNFIAIHGRLTRDPDRSTTQSGVSVCKFTVAVDRKYARSGEEKQTDFFYVKCWRGLADMVSKHFHKGKEIIVVGEMQSRDWTDNGGNERVSWEIMANSVYFCGSKGNASNSTEATEHDTPVDNTGGFTDISDDESKYPF